MFSGAVMQPDGAHQGPPVIGPNGTANMFLEGGRMQERTRKEYIRLAEHFIGERVKHVTPRLLKEALVACAAEYRPAYWRRLRCALAVQQEEAGYKDLAADIRKLENPITKSGDRSQIKPKQRRIKAVNQEDGKRLGDFLNERGELGDMQLLHVLHVVDMLGVRPAEIPHIQIRDGLAVVQGAKQSHGGLRGAGRTLLLDPIVAERLQCSLEVLDGVDIGPLQDRLRAAGRHLWPRRTALPTLYTFRHQMGSDLKASGMDRRQIAYIMGHQATGSVDVYGDRRVARSNGRSLPRIPEGTDLSEVRETHNEKTPNGYKPAKPVKARSVSIKNNKNKGMDLGGFDM